MWATGSLRLLSIVDDDGFVNYTEHVNRVMGKIKIIEECVYFSASTDTWTSRNNYSFINFTVYYLDGSFNMNNWILEATELSGKHTTESIARALKCFPKNGA